MKRIIYADNAATTGLEKIALEAMAPWLSDVYGNASQPYSFARGPKEAIANARQTIAKSINVSPEEIFFTSGGTESDNWAIKGTLLNMPQGQQVITSAIEHHAVLRTCESLTRLGYPVDYIQPDRHGHISPESLKDTLSPTTKLVSVMYTNNEIGTIEPIEELARIAHQHGALFHTDAVQAVGHIPIDVKALGVDMLSASAHKFNGPKGIGFLYIRKGIDIIPLIDGGSQESGMRAGTENVAAIVGMAKALEVNVASLSENEKHIRYLEEKFIKLLDGTGLDYIRNGSSDRLPGCINLSFKNADGEMLLHRLDLMGICVSTGSACNGNNTEVSHVLQAIAVPADYIHGTIRVSLGKNNTVEEVQAIVAAIKKILA